MNYIIRDCERKDLPALVGLCAEHAIYEQAEYSPEGKLERLEQALFAEHPPLFCQVVECDGVVAGYVSYVFEYTTWDAGYILYMDCLFLLSQYRGNGIGRVIMDKLVVIAAEKSCVAIEWQTPSFNADGIRFYKKIGAIGNEKIRFAIKL